jgi:hypothetical protein
MVTDIVWLQWENALYVKDNPMIALGYISLVVSVKTINESFSH